MKLKLSEYAKREYPEHSRPHMGTLRKMAANGDIPGAHQTSSGRWFVEIDAHKRSTEAVIKNVLGNDPELLKAAGL